MILDRKGVGCECEPTFTGIRNPHMHSQNTFPLSESPGAWLVTVYILSH